MGGKLVYIRKDGTYKSVADVVTHSPFSDNQSAVFDDSGYTVEWDNPYRGSVSRVTAGQVYKASKNGDIQTLPETISMLYDAANDKSSLAVKMQSYTRDANFYDGLTNLTRALLNNDYKTAQRLINYIEHDSIKRAGKKSSYYKYRNQL